MNKFLTYEGQQPVYLDDIDYLQNSVAEVLKGVVSALSLDNSGSIIFTKDMVLTEQLGGSQIKYNVLGGFMAINGEVYPVQQGSFTVASGTTLYWRVVVEKIQNEFLGNNIEVPVYERRYVRLSTTVEETERYALYGQTKTFLPALLELAKSYLTVPEIDVYIATQLPSGASASNALRYVKSSLGVESIEYRLICGEAFTVPLISGKRRLFTFDKSVKNISTQITARYITDPNDSSKYNTYVLTFDSGNCYIADTSGNPISTLPMGAMNETKYL